MQITATLPFLFRIFFFVLFNAVLSAQNLPQAALVKDINPGPGGSSPANFIKLANGKIFFSANNNLWITDGTGAGTGLAPFTPSLAGYGYPTKPVLLNGKIYFIMAAANFVTLWSTTDNLTASLVDTIVFHNTQFNFEEDFGDMYAQKGSLYINIRINYTVFSGYENYLFQHSGQKGSLKQVGLLTNAEYDNTLPYFNSAVFYGASKLYIVENITGFAPGNPPQTLAGGISVRNSLSLPDTFNNKFDYNFNNYPVTGLGLVNDDLICVYNDTLLRITGTSGRQVLGTGYKNADPIGQLGNLVYFQIHNTNKIARTNGAPGGTVFLTVPDSSLSYYSPIIINDTLFISGSGANNFTISKVDNAHLNFQQIFSLKSFNINLGLFSINNKLYLTANTLNISSYTTTFYEPDYLKGRVKIIGQADNVNNSFFTLNNLLYMGAGDTPKATTLTGVELKSLSLTPSAVDYPCLNDTTPPVITNCPGNLTVSAPHPPICSAQSINLPTAYDNCTLAITIVGAKKGSIGLNPPDINNGNPYYLYCSPVVDTITYYARDLSYNVSSCSFTVTVPSADPCANDITPPVFTNCPKNITQTLPSPCTGSNCGAQVSWTPPTATDNCSSVSLTGNYNPGFFPVGTTNVVYTATDAANNKASCAFTVTIQPFKIDNHFVNTNKKYLPPNGGQNTSAYFTIKTLPESLAPTTIFPNPTDGEAFIDLTAYVGKTVTLTIADLAGKILSVEKIDNPDVEPRRLDVSALWNGIYFVSFQTPGKQPEVKKLEIVK